MESKEITQFEIVELCKECFLKGKLEALDTLIVHFEVFKPRIISKKDLLAALRMAKLQIQEAL